MNSYIDYFTTINARIIFVYLFVVILGCQSEKEVIDAPNNVDKYNVVWESPSKNHKGSMPIGNGDIGLNFWAEETGDLCFYIGKTDSWGDNGRLLKVGKVRIACEPKVQFSEGTFEQTLDLKTGRILISSKGVYKEKEVDLNFELWVDANNPVIHLSHKSSLPISMRANIELWRTKPDSLTSIGISDLLENRSKPGSLHEPVIVEPDNIISNANNYIGWFHHNKKSVGFDLTNSLQGLSEYYKNDPILHRTFGAIIKGNNIKKVNDVTLKTAENIEGRIDVYVLTKKSSSPQKWLKDIKLLSENIEDVSFIKRKNKHKKWWRKFWERSFIDASPADSTTTNKLSDAYIISRAYALQRFIDASAGRGRYPIKFNGSIFTVPHKDKPGDADFRRWGPGYWWQNTRLPYLSMLASGDQNQMAPLFKMYANDIYKLSKFRTKKYFNFDGAYFPECAYFWGSVFTATYGWTPYEKRSDRLQESPWHKWEWVAGPELVFMMLNYYDYTQDQKFLKNKIIPVATDVMKFFDNNYQVNDSGKIEMHPSMALETWWDCTNPMPELAGLHGITKRLISLPRDLVSKQERDFWISFKNKLPILPTRETPTGKALAPAMRHENKRNFENPELYAVFPFRHYGIGKDSINIAIRALENRWDKGSFGWRQDDLFMAYLGLTKSAKKHLVARAKNFDKDSRFPAFWGPNYDWTPDQDHGGILMKTFQSMLLQVDPYSRKIYLLPAWPEDWNVNFKLHAPYKTVIEGEIKNGKIKNLKVTPASREKDIVFLNK